MFNKISKQKVDKKNDYFLLFSSFGNFLTMGKFDWFESNSKNAAKLNTL